MKGALDCRATMVWPLSGGPDSPKPLSLQSIYLDVTEEAATEYDQRGDPDSQSMALRNHQA